jgi:hypothetical protein
VEQRHAYESLQAYGQIFEQVPLSELAFNQTYGPDGRKGKNATDLQLILQRSMRLQQKSVKIGTRGWMRYGALKARRPANDARIPDPPQHEIFEDLGTLKPEIVKVTVYRSNN